MIVARAKRDPRAIFLEKDMRSLRRVQRGIAITMRSVTTERTQKTIFAVLDAEAQIDAIVSLYLWVGYRRRWDQS